MPSITYPEFESFLKGVYSQMNLPGRPANVRQGSWRESLELIASFKPLSPVLRLPIVRLYCPECRGGTDHSGGRCLEH